jgi:class 3 adenylate cyclase
VTLVERPEDLLGAQGRLPARPFRRRRNRLIGASTAALLLLLVLISLQAIGAFSAMKLPKALASPLTHTLLGALVFFFVVRTYTEATRSIALTSRFIRPGLRRLLEARGGELERGVKLFRGRSTAVMKVDIADFTATTFDMPYGMRRLFVDLWFTFIDKVVADRVFLDKSLGDGSVYYFDTGETKGPCEAALDSAIEIRTRQVEAFDVAFRRQLCRRLAESEELARHSEHYFKSFRARTGESFWDRSTEIRIAIVAGYVDEGLWGLSSQSHYDAQGVLPILATRFEEQASNGAIVMDVAFLDKLEAECPGRLDRSSLVRETFELKGIGPWEVYVLNGEPNPPEATGKAHRDADRSEGSRP